MQNYLPAIVDTQLGKDGVRIWIQFCIQAILFLLPQETAPAKVVEFCQIEVRESDIL
jgi:hypothetical protein